MFIMAMELISRKISSKDVLRKVMYADDLESCRAEFFFLKLKIIVLRACVMACLYSMETVALTEQQQKLQVCENNWHHLITRIKDE